MSTNCRRIMKPPLNKRTVRKTKHGIVVNKLPSSSTQRCSEFHIFIVTAEVDQTAQVCTRVLVRMGVLRAIMTAPTNLLRQCTHSLHCPFALHANLEAQCYGYVLCNVVMIM